ncbi:MAG: hypothetical protein ACYS5V_14095 [Planctomycetota bacterium]
MKYRYRSVAPHCWWAAVWNPQPAVSATSRTARRSRSITQIVARSSGSGSRSSNGRRRQATYRSDGLHGQTS